MKKLIRGLLDFQRHTVGPYRETFARLAQGQTPDCLFITCADSRVVPNLLVSTDPGDLFTVRNVGNMVPPAHEDGHGHSTGDRSDAAAIEYALGHLPVTDVVVCGHSGCGAMKALLSGGVERAPNLEAWLKNGESALKDFHTGRNVGVDIPEADRLSQLNVLSQLEHIQTYPVVQARLRAGTLRLHGWWFDIGHAQVHTFRQSLQRFVPIDEAQGEALLRELDAPGPRAGDAIAEVA
ncbi:MAG: carbonic anhydrase [Myxococcota bacterium]|nr:carbonic anhydrase [Myxococcota bacterium]